MFKKPKRPSDWGDREKHPLYKRWHWHKNRTSAGMEPKWAEDFWSFVAGVGDDRPGMQLRRVRPSEKMGPENFVWVVPTPSKDKAAYARHWRAANPRKSKSIDLKKSYGITLEDWERMYAAQEGACAICKTSEHEKSERYANLAVDHCHTTGRVRGLLCNTCNRALGMFQDNPEYLLRAAKYLGA